MKLKYCKEKIKNVKNIAKNLHSVFDVDESWNLGRRVKQVITTCERKLIKYCVSKKNTIV